MCSACCLSFTASISSSPVSPHINCCFFCCVWTVHLAPFVVVPPFFIAKAKESFDISSSGTITKVGSQQKIGKCQDAFNMCQSLFLAFLDFSASFVTHSHQMEFWQPKHHHLGLQEQPPPPPTISQCVVVIFSLAFCCVKFNVFFLFCFACPPEYSHHRHYRHFHTKCFFSVALLKCPRRRKKFFSSPICLLRFRFRITCPFKCAFDGWMDGWMDSWLLCNFTGKIWREIHAQTMAQ